jgi:beta-lactamase regulating signal transducer with metallopeptidase domain
MDPVTVIVWIVVIVIGTIVVQYLFNPYFNRMGLRKKEEKVEEKSEEERKKEEEFYREIWSAKKRKS